MTTDRSKAILELLVRKEIDVALTVGALTSEGLIHHELYNDSYSFYVSNLNKERYFSRATIAKLAVLFIPDASDENGRSLRDYLHLWDLKFHEKFNLDSFEVVGEFTKRNYGIGILPNQVAKRYKKTIRPVKIEGAGPKCFGTHRFFLSYRDDLELPNSLIKHLLETAHQAVRRLDQA
ncbi:MAG: hypothetical protein EOP09_20375 [Proteobacteria bacterium]|nr:MAG: hypothetical protein EOP09_20375 [Pseudomonadota bacterium]